MKKGRFILIHNDTFVYRFEFLVLAERYASSFCRGIYEFYVIVDTEKDEVASRWSYCP